jgi:hypothetical protein
MDKGFCSAQFDQACAGARRTGVHDTALVTVAILFFAGIDIGAVVIALLWLSDRRVQDDKTDQRNQKRPIRYR